MLAYQIDGNGIFIGVCNRQIDPLETIKQGVDVYLVPAGAITVEPPSFEEGQYARWTGDEWVIETIPVPEEEEQEEPIQEQDSPEEEAVEEESGEQTQEPESPEEEPEPTEEPIIEEEPAQEDDIIEEEE